MLRRIQSAVLLLLLAAGFSLSQQMYPVAVVTAPADATLRRSGGELTIALRAGDLLYPGDAVASEGAGLTIWFCPSREEITFAPRVSFITGQSAPALRNGSVQQRRALPICELPLVPQGSSPAFSGRRLARDEGPLPETELEARIDSLPAAQRDQARQALSAADGLLRSDPANPAALTVRGAILRRYKIHRPAAGDYRRAAERWNSVDWPRALVHEDEDLERQLRPAASALTGSGSVYALVIGVSQYEHLAPDEQLQYADQDAIAFSRYLQSRKGGGIPEANIQLLTNKEATVSSIRTAITTFLQAQAGKQDTVILFLAAHGVVDQRGAYILGSDSHPEDLRNTAVPMTEIQKLLGEEFSNIGKILIFLDVCRAGTVGAIRSNRVSRVVGTLLDGAETYGLLASGPGESSWESDRFGGGHGAFSYFLLRAMNGDGDSDGDKRVTADEVFDYVYRNVREATKRKQNPRVTGGMTGSVIMVADTTQAGIELLDWRPIDAQIAQARQSRRPIPAGPDLQNRSGETISLPEALQFEMALSQGRVLPSENGNAFDLLQPLRIRLRGNRLDYLTFENQLWVELLDRGQQVLLRYLKGDELVPNRDDFASGEAYYRAALQIDPEALALESRALFCEGRKLIFDKQYAEAIRVLERAVRIDSNGAYIYNAIGIAYLELSKLPEAASAFRDAVRLAPLWVYPQHNLALTLGEQGQYEEARRVLANAQRLSPSAWYLPYTAGLIEQRNGQFTAAVRSFRSASALAPDRPEAFNAMGYLEASRGNTKAAGILYGESLRRSPSYLPARHNSALLTAQNPQDRPKAILMWTQLVTDAPGFLPARLSLAETLAAEGRWAHAVEEYTRIIDSRPDYVSARAARAGALVMLGRWQEAVSDWRAALAARPGNAVLLKHLAEAAEKLGRPDEALELYRQAAANTRDRKMAKQIRSRIQDLSR